MSIMTDAMGFMSMPVSTSPTQEETTMAKCQNMETEISWKRDGEVRGYDLQGDLTYQSIKSLQRGVLYMSDFGKQKSDK